MFIFHASARSRSKSTTIYRSQAKRKILSATISERAGRWFVSLQVEQEITVPVPVYHVIGVDVGIKNLAVTSDGVVFENPRVLKSTEKRIRFLQKAVSRKQKGSINRKKVIKKLAQQHFHVACMRKDAIHKATNLRYPSRRRLL